MTALGYHQHLLLTLLELCFPGNVVQRWGLVSLAIAIEQSAVSSRSQHMIVG